MPMIVWKVYQCVCRGQTVIVSGNTLCFQQIAACSSSIGITTNTTSDFSSTCVVLALVAGRQDCQPRPNSQRQPLRLFLSSFRLQHFYMTVNIASEMHSNASRSLTQPLLDCMLYLTHYLYDPGTLPSSANQCILGNVYLRSNLSRK